MKNQNSSYFVGFVIVVALMLGLVFAGENVGRTIVILMMLAGWGIYTIRSGDLVRASFLLLLAVFPLNISFQLNFLSGWFDPYIEGVFVPYLVPTVHIVDLALFLLVCSGFVQYGVRFVKKYRYILGVGLAYYVFHNVVHLNSVTLVISSRYLLMLFSGVVLYEYFHELFTTKNFIKMKSVFRSVAFVLSVSVLLQFTIAVLQVMIGRSVGLGLMGESNIIGSFMGVSYVNFGNGNILRAYGTFAHPNILGGYFVASIIFFLFYSNLCNGVSKYLMYVLSVVASIGVLLTFSRVAFVLTAIVWIVYILRRFYDYRINKKRDRLSAFVLTQSWYDRLVEIFNESNVSINERIELINKSITLILRNPILGIGIGRFVYAMGASSPTNRIGISIFEPVHNIFLLAIVENGIVIGVSVLIFIFYLIYHAVRKSVGIIRVLLLLATVCVFLSGLFDHYLLTSPQGNILLMVYLLLVVIIYKLNFHEIYDF